MSKSLGQFLSLPSSSSGQALRVPATLGHCKSRRARGGTVTPCRRTTRVRVLWLPGRRSWPGRNLQAGGRDKLGPGGPIVIMTVMHCPPASLSAPGSPAALTQPPRTRTLIEHFGLSSVPRNSLSTFPCLPPPGAARESMQCLSIG